MIEFGEGGLPHPDEMLDVVIRDELKPINPGYFDGRSSAVYRVDDYVVKISRKLGDHFQMVQEAGKLIDESNDNADFVGEYMPRTRIEPVVPGGIYRGSQDSRVVTVQDYRQGFRLAEAVKEPDFDPTAVIDFFDKALKMYRRKYKLPDIAAIEHGFNAFRTHNLVIDPDTHWPTLIDTTLGRTQRSDRLGSLWNDRISTGAWKAMNKLKQLQ